MGMSQFYMGILRYGSIRVTAQVGAGGNIWDALTAVNFLGKNR